MKSVSENPRKIGMWLVWVGSVFLGVSVLLFVAIFWPILVLEYRYATSDYAMETERISISASNKGPGTIVPVDSTFSIIVPKIGANAPVVPLVDPDDEMEYRARLRDGVAHAVGSKYPGEKGNAFFFAHSSDDFYAQSRYNTVFYLLNKLVPDDRFYIVRSGFVYEYRVYETKMVAPEEIAYLDAVSESSVATLMTCWPPGTSSQRLLVFGVLEGVYEDGEVEINN